MSITGAARERIYWIRKHRPASAGFFDQLAKLQHNMKKTSLSVVEKSSGMNRQLSLKLMKEIAETGVASVRGGGGGEESYLAWNEDVDCREIGKDTDTPLR
jgi:hypothetical protein